MIGIVLMCSKEKEDQCHGNFADGKISLTGLPPCDICKFSEYYKTEEEYQKLLLKQKKIREKEKGIKNELERQITEMD